MPHPPRILEVLLSLAVAGGALVFAGCPSPEERTCDVLCDCTGCSEARYRDCVNETEIARKGAEQASCPAGAFDELLTCVEDELECKDDKFTFDGCEDRQQSLRQCGVFVFRTVCEHANDVFIECGQGAAFEVDPDACTGPIACQAGCVIDTSCDGVNGLDQEESSRFNECTFACFQMK
ncbi:hypothetical protein WMF37_36595 [Sorangium sp. So ce291]|uniref:hypothetical protein n=1 Tax=Sorangium sp. So ce291 TaxID=3133294 RepID=UPI003F60F89D